MTTSGSSNYNNTRNEIIESSLRKMGILAEGETATAGQIANAAGDLERLIKSWQTKGVKLWAYQELTLFLNTTSEFYRLGSTGDHCALTEDVIETTLSVAAASGVSSVTLTNAAGIVSGDYIGIAQDNNTIHWTTVNGAPSGNVVTLTAATTNAAALAKPVYSYTTRASRPLQVYDARARLDSQNETPCRVLSRSDYFNLSNKRSSGTPNQFYYNPTLEQGRLYVYPIADQVTKQLRLTAYRSLEDFDSANNTPDLPQEWIQALIWNLASEIALEYGVDPDTRTFIQAKADYWYIQVSEFDQEEAELVICPDFSDYGY
jgi:hypothetical protein